jgi:hypothetical protein
LANIHQNRASVTTNQHPTGLTAQKQNLLQKAAHSQGGGNQPNNGQNNNTNGTNGTNGAQNNGQNATHPSNNSNSVQNPPPPIHNKPQQQQHQHQQQSSFFVDSVDDEPEEPEEQHSTEYDTHSFKLTANNRATVVASSGYPPPSSSQNLNNNNNNNNQNGSPNGNQTGSSNGNQTNPHSGSFSSTTNTATSTNTAIYQPLNTSQPSTTSLPSLASSAQPLYDRKNNNSNVSPNTILDPSIYSPADPRLTENGSNNVAPKQRIYGTIGLRSELYPDSPEHLKILNLIRTRSMALYNAVYKINRTFTNVPTPNQNIYNKLVSQTQMITERLDKFDKKNNSDAKLQEQQQQREQQQQQQQPQAVPISQALKQYPDILASCWGNSISSDTIVMLLNSIYELQRAHTLDFDAATTIEAAYAYHHQKLESLQQQEEDSRRKAIAATKEFLALKLKEDHKKVEKTAMTAYNAIRAHEHDRKESCFQIIHTDLASTGTILRPLNGRLQSYWNYFQKGVELMKPFEPLLKELQKRCERDDEFVSAQLTQLAKDQESLDKQLKQYLNKLGLLEHVQQTALLPDGVASPGGTNTTGFRDLDNKKANREIGTTKRGFLFTPPPMATRVWVELKDQTLKVSEEIHQHASNAKSTASGHPQTEGAGSRFQNLLDKVTQETKPGYGGNTTTTQQGDGKTESLSTTYKVIFETSTLLLTAKAVRDSKYRNVFQAIGPAGNCSLQAESDVIMNEWLDVIQNAVGNDLTLAKQDKKPNLLDKKEHAKQRRSVFAHQQANMDPNALSSRQQQQQPYNPTEVLKQLQSVPGNSVCCDCGSPNPDWVSINLGILLCLDCSGAHRQLGVSVSKIRSVMMDKLDIHTITYCCSLGNTLVNHILLEFHEHEKTVNQRTGATDTALYITPNSPRLEKMEHIRAKYQDRRWVLQDILLTPKTRLNLSNFQIDERVTRLTTLLYNGIRQDSISNVFRACVSGVDPTKTISNETVPPLFESILYNCPTFLTCMLQFTENVDFREERGWNCLHYAAYVNSIEIAELVLAVCGSELAVGLDTEGKTPREVAMYFNSGEKEFALGLPQLLNLLTSAEEKYKQRLAKKSY